MSEAIIKEGGPAFPVSKKMAECHTGMTMRDYYATHASEADIDAVLDEKRKVGFPVWRSQARYIFADAMLFARDCKGGSFSFYNEKGERVE